MDLRIQEQNANDWTEVWANFIHYRKSNERKINSIILIISNNVIRNTEESQNNIIKLLNHLAEISIEVTIIFELELFLSSPVVRWMSFINGQYDRIKLVVERFNSKNINNIRYEFIASYADKNNVPNLSSFNELEIFSDINNLDVVTLILQLFYKDDIIKLYNSSILYRT